MNGRYPRAASAVLMALATLVFLAGCSSPATTRRTSSARVDFVVGEVAVDGRSVEAGAVLRPVFHVSTGPDSEVGIMFDDKNILRIEPETEAYIDLTADVRTVELRKGGLSSALRRLEQVTTREIDRFRVKTPSAVAGVRGTVFFARVEDPSHTYLCICNGTLHLSDARGSGGLTSEATHHQGHRFELQPDGASVRTDAGLLYHTDQGMEALAAGIGESIAWGTLERH